MSKAATVEAVEALIERISGKEKERHAARMKAIEQMAKRLRSGKAKGITGRDTALLRLAELSNEFTAIVSEGRFMDSASREWKALPMHWRTMLLLQAGVGMDSDDLDRLAARNWREFPPPERQAIRDQVRNARQHFPKLVALAARV